LPPLATGLEVLLADRHARVSGNAARNVSARRSPGPVRPLAPHAALAPRRLRRGTSFVYLAALRLRRSAGRLDVGLVPRPTFMAPIRSSSRRATRSASARAAWSGLRPCSCLARRCASWSMIAPSTAAVEVASSEHDEGVVASRSIETRGSDGRLLDQGPDLCGAGEGEIARAPGSVQQRARSPRGSLGGDHFDTPAGQRRPARGSWRGRASTALLLPGGLTAIGQPRRSPGRSCGWSDIPWGFQGLTKPQRPDGWRIVRSGRLAVVLTCRLGVMPHAPPETSGRTRPRSHLSVSRSATNLPHLRSGIVTPSSGLGDDRRLMGAHRRISPRSRSVRSAHMLAPLALLGVSSPAAAIASSTSSSADLHARLFFDVSSAPPASPRGASASLPLPLVRRCYRLGGDVRAERPARARRQSSCSARQAARSLTNFVNPMAIWSPSGDLAASSPRRRSRPWPAPPRFVVCTRCGSRSSPITASSPPSLACCRACGLGWLGCAALL